MRSKGPGERARRPRTGDAPLPPHPVSGPGGTILNPRVCACLLLLCLEDSAGYEKSLVLTPRSLSSPPPTCPYMYAWLDGILIGLGCPSPPGNSVIPQVPPIILVQTCSWSEGQPFRQGRVFGLRSLLTGSSYAALARIASLTNTSNSFRPGEYDRGRDGRTWTGFSDLAHALHCSLGWGGAKDWSVVMQGRVAPVCRKMVCKMWPQGKMVISSRHIVWMVSRG